ncbi:hypothetical protein LTS08_007131 [Lithohypha guttulata]|uniref:TauD/TfdA-like domain-containing protein n=1 Tax=Lithohypha guttulata TaxID=1690604 RepID=A0AAN7T1S6_9EURO|nr:hypothetical protein LTR05_003885 [Lithohypha guttulata]KAK5097110.1 hypothetical protein LTS08_007131 [Lithohypha guttulata]
MLDHIRYSREDIASEDLRPTELAVAMGLHTDADAGQIQSMMMVTKSQSGGNQYLSSFNRVYADLQNFRPEVLSTLAHDWHWEKPFRKPVMRPIVAVTENGPQINYGRTFLAGHAKYPRSTSAPALTKAQVQALAVLADTAERYAFRLDLDPGDVVFINNLNMLHSRDEFKDGSDPSSQRHLMRLWLNDEHYGHAVAPQLKYASDDLFGHRPEDQDYKTLSEWRSTARRQRTTNIGHSSSNSALEKDLAAAERLREDHRTTGNDNTSYEAAGARAESASVSKPATAPRKSKSEAESVQSRSHD